ncbi:MAG: hypothetical protein E6J87_19460 [Deltaproteobacteria bacterium]|nr:MAG: hypothetical protein E6J87_19460 [Deltaproteobacteria bacterium]
MHDRLAARREMADEQVCVEISREQTALEEDQAGGPRGGQPAVPRDDELPHQRLDLEQQERAEEDRDGVRDPDRGPSRAGK